MIGDLAHGIADHDRRLRHLAGVVPDPVLEIPDLAAVIADLAAVIADLAAVAAGGRSVPENLVCRSYDHALVVLDHALVVPNLVREVG